MMLLRSFSLVFAITISFSAFSQDQLPSSQMQNDQTPLTLEEYKAIERYARSQMKTFEFGRDIAALHLKNFAAENPTYAHPRRWRYIPYGLVIGALGSLIPATVAAVVTHSTGVLYPALRLSLYTGAVGVYVGGVVWALGSRPFRGDKWLESEFEIGGKYAEFGPNRWLPQTPGLGLSKFHFQLEDQLLTRRDLINFGVQFEHSLAIPQVIELQLKLFEERYVVDIDPRWDERSKAESDGHLMRLTAFHWLHSEQYNALSLLANNAGKRIAELTLKQTPNCVSEMLKIAEGGS